MSRVLFISDMHLGHRNVIQFDNRPFTDVETMDQMLIEYWNMRVQKDDDVYIIGDFCYRSDKGPVWYLKKLKGKKHLVIGNHDNIIVRDEHALSFFENVDKMMHVNDNGQQIQLCHFPITEWNSYYRGSYLVYGHIHNRLNETTFIMRSRKRAFNAAACINNYMPVTFDELVANNKRFEAEYPIRWSDLPPTELKHLERVSSFDKTERKRFNRALDGAIRGLELEARCYNWEAEPEYQEVVTFLKEKKGNEET